MCLIDFLIEFIEFLSQSDSILRLQITENVSQQCLRIEIMLILLIVLRRVVLEGEQTIDTK